MSEVDGEAGRDNDGTSGDVKGSRCVSGGCSGVMALQAKDLQSCCATVCEIGKTDKCGMKDNFVYSCDTLLATN